MRESILINCSNLHTGGAVAVASSFIFNLCQQQNGLHDIAVLVSSLVDRNLKSLGAKTENFGSYSVIDYVGLSALWKRLDRHFIGHRIVFTVFGPAYFFRKRTVHIFGFAQPSIAYPDNLYSRSLPPFQRLRTRLTFLLQAWFFSRADELIVELAHVKESLERQKLFAAKSINVVSSAVDSIYSDSGRWQPLPIESRNNHLKLGVISRNYPHKNIRCFPEIKVALKKLYSVDAKFFVTFPEDEWSKCGSIFRESVVNIGPLTLAQCPMFYQAMDGIVFPSLLECFSAVPIESMRMKTPVFASQLPFINDCCQEHAIYFDPLSPESAAKAIYEYFQKPAIEQSAFLEGAYSFVRKYSSAEARAESYMNIIRRKLQESSCTV